METLPTEKKGGFRSLLGQFATKDFWLDILKSMLQEAMAAFFMTLGGVLLFYGKNKRNKEMVPNMEGSPVAQKAFGGGYQPTYQPASYPVAPTPTGDNRFPGFGPR